jgi:FtsH-binding integral membrane protein
MLAVGECARTGKTNMAYTPDFRSYSGRASGVAGVAALDEGLRTYMLRVYNWMASGLLLTGITAYGIANTSLLSLFYHAVPTAYGMRIAPTGLGTLSIFAPLAFVLAMSFGVNRMSRTTVQALYWAFCVAMGASLTNIFLIYAHDSIARVFFITAATFAGMSIWGYTTKANLTGVGSFLIMGLWGIIIAGLVNMFLHSSGLQFAVSIIGVVVFTGLTAYDTQRIKLSYTQFAYAEGPDGAARRSVYDALSLYLNFINLFVLLLQLMGNRNSNS